MASAILHIKDSYYFEVPKALWRVDYQDKSEFPAVWVRLDPEYRMWEADRLLAELEALQGESGSAFASLDLPAESQLKSDYEHWKHDDHANAGKPFSVFLRQEAAPEWFDEHLLDETVREAWEGACERAGDVSEFRQSNVEWSPEKIERYNEHLSGRILIPQPFGELRNLYQAESGLCISKFMIIEVIVALILWGLFSWLGRRIGESDRPRGRLWNLLEVFVVYIRDQVARPAIGKHDADRFVPLLLTLFFFILGCNLMGLLPWLGSPTGSWGVTFGMAVVTFGTVVVFGMAKFGVIGFFVNQIPSMDLPLVLAVFLYPLILAIELAGLLIKHTVLSVRLLANMVAGHIVLLAIMGLAFSLEGAMIESNLVWGLTAATALFGATAISCLELFVALLQAYIFTFLSALFIGAAIHHH